jgi:hypothetical protein
MRAAVLCAALAVACASRAPTPISAPVTAPVSAPVEAAVDAGPADIPPATPAAVALRGATKLALTAYASCALAAGRVVCWRGGDALWAPAGRVNENDDPPFRHGAVATPGLTEVTDLCASNESLCALRADGVRCRAVVSPIRGDEASGGGDGEDFPSAVVEGAPAGLGDVVALETQFAGCVAVARDGGRRFVLAPTTPTGAWTARAVAADVPRCTLVGGAPRCVGDNTRALLANSTARAFTAASPSTLFGLTGVRAVGFGERHACAALGDGTLRCWGRNLEAQLGTGDLRSRALPTLIAGIDGVAALGLGRSYTCALREAGDVRCWGLNTNGVFGEASTEARRAPTADAVLTEVEELVTQESYACVRRRDGSVWCWGAVEGSTQGPRPQAITMAPTG